MEDRSNAPVVVAAPESAAKPPAPAAAVPLPYAEAAKKVRELAVRQLDRFLSYEAKVLKGDNPDSIHDMRVASRRLQEALDLLFPKPRSHEVRVLRRQIRRCRQALGDIRNCDVLLEIVRRSLGRKRSARREAWTAVQHYLVQRRSETFQRAMRKFGKINLAVLYVSLKELLQEQKVDDHPDAHHAHHAHGESTPPDFTRELSTALTTAWNEFEGHVAESHRHARPDVVHGARIATKRLRYRIEVFHDFGVAGSADALAWLRQLQNHLGDWHDLEVLEQMTIEMLARPEFLREHLPLAMEVEKLILRNRKTKAGLGAKYTEMSRESEGMLRLKEWVAYVLTSPSEAAAKA